MSTTTADATVEAAEEAAEETTGVVDAQDQAQEPDEGDDSPDSDSDWRKNFDPDRAAARIAKIQSENKNLRERAKAAEEKAKQISALEAENLRLTVGYELQLPHELARRLQGATRDELIEDAKGLIELVGPTPAASRKPVEVLRGGGRPDVPPEETDLDKIGSRMFRR